MPYNPDIHHRRSIRLKGYDYAQAGLYFITICVKNRWDIFGKIENGEMIMNAYGTIAMEQWQKTEEIRDNCSIHDSIIMPNHLLGIIEIHYKKGDDKEIGTFKSPSHSIGSIIRGFKIATIKEIKALINNRSSTGELQFALKEKALKEKALKEKALKEKALKEKPREEKALKKEAPKEKSGLDLGELRFAPTTTAPTEKIKSLDFKIWQRNYYEHIIRNEQAYNNIAAYIKNNPKKWEEDNFYKK